MGRFADAKEVKSECELCEREGFTTSFALPERSLILLVVTDFRGTLKNHFSVPHSYIRFSVVVKECQVSSIPL